MPDAVVVLDNGAGDLKAGFAGEADLRHVVPHCTARLPKQLRVLTADETEDLVKNKSQLRYTVRLPAPPRLASRPPAIFDSPANCHHPAHPTRRPRSLTVALLAAALRPWLLHQLGVRERHLDPRVLRQASGGRALAKLPALHA